MKCGICRLELLKGRCLRCRLEITPAEIHREEQIEAYREMVSAFEDAGREDWVVDTDKNT